ncbi:MAG: hypothetical protein AAGF12_29755 [Myxococcota bacterium]
MSWSEPPLHPADLSQLNRAFTEYALREALGAYVAPDTHDMVLAFALEFAGQHELPSEGEQLSAFVRGSLHKALTQFFGEDVARMVVAELSSILPPTMSMSGIMEGVDGESKSGVHLFPEPPTRPRTIPPLHSRVSTVPELGGGNEKTTVPAGARGISTIFMLTGDLSAYHQISKSMEEYAAVIRTSQAPPVIAALQVHDFEPLIVVDGRNGVDQLLLEELSEHLAPDTQLVLWGQSSASERFLNGGDVIAFEAEAEAEDVAAMLGILAGR